VAGFSFVKFIHNGPKGVIWLKGTSCTVQFGPVHEDEKYNRRGTWHLGEGVDILSWLNGENESERLSARLPKIIGLFAARLWARRILDCFRNAVAVEDPCHAPLFTDPDREAIRDLGLGRYRARHIQHRCACFA
jgi:hypothetical protein